MIFPKKIRFFILFFSAIFKKQSKNILIGLILGIASYFSFPLLYKLVPKPKLKIKIGIVGQHTVNEIPEKILKEISSGLVNISENGEIIPALAESWKIENEGKTYIFKIKPQSFVWHDNQDLVPADINYNFKVVE
jgi:ABC-type transport system substrate-binding protein